MDARDPQIGEKRKTPRISLRGKIVLAKELEFGSITLGGIQNVSNGGLKVIDFRGHLQNSDTVNFEILEDYLRLHGQGKIVWISPDGSTAGIEFLQLDEENAMSLEYSLKLKE